ncbi:hypothetical protein C5B42_03385 [Candidatus Cerribacteria bacterium 'Amazon FNV 2010 28 9']|uniref:Uncharacterized protein n=1 Tax=Candidatus Cerribacteria bacterium 'Amazon FNV 2010 28 9' TaxID=2081795 RepID=A0A317JTN9_9BACT|nr:MAG: hypothetical protein C5B42_03385 [Candidatus Cerribacteria bacterium 'Amazon FNV 2010 28 9']
MSTKINDLLLKLKGKVEKDPNAREYFFVVSGMDVVNLLEALQDQGFTVHSPHSGGFDSVILVRQPLPDRWLEESGLKPRREQQGTGDLDSCRN